VAYLSRFLLNFDPSARAWWDKRGCGDSWDRSRRQLRERENAFADFAASVEVGLTDYFSGPYGSYSSVSAAMAGLTAAQPAPSARVGPTGGRRRGLMDGIFAAGGGGGGGKNLDPNQDPAEVIDMARQGILNLYALLKARYTSLQAKRQLAILFSFIQSPALQPVDEIRSLLGEVDNCTVTETKLLPRRADARSEADSRTSPLRGGGYAASNPPRVDADPPPPLGDEYPEAVVVPTMRGTSRVLRITLLDGGEGYTSAPSVTVVQNGIRRACKAAALLDREGRVESIVVLDPGFGYGGLKRDVPPKVRIEAPPKTGRKALAVAELEYGIAGLKILDGGNGYVSTEPPGIQVTPPEEVPDWFLEVQEDPKMRFMPMPAGEQLRGVVAEMKFADGSVAFSEKEGLAKREVVNDELLARLKSDPLEMLPSSLRPDLIRDGSTGKLLYSFPEISAMPQSVAVLSPRYRAFDPVFGGVGRVPVTKGAVQLKASEYARLALSGAICTIVVRTALNPLELVKTKQMLQTDTELFEYTASRTKGKEEKPPKKPPSFTREETRAAQPRALASSNGTAVIAEPEVIEDVSVEVEEKSKEKVKLGTNDLIRGIIELRGPWALFQSADITFLASLMFGTFGFGATELFRRSFTQVFFEDGEAASGSAGSEVVLLLAAAVATVVTAATASPFELLRVRSMAYLEGKPWTLVLRDFLVSSIR
jgi:hypothetical protein